MAVTETVRKPELRVEHGRARPSRLRLNRPSYTIGSAADCDIVTQGDKVSAVHATVELDSTTGGWVVRNKSNFGILVNRRPADVATIAPGDQIQVGESLLLSFQGKLARSGTTAEPAKQKRGGSTRQVVIGALVGVYLLGIGALMIVLSAGGDKSADGGLTADYLEDVLTATEQHLQDLRLPAGESEPGSIQASQLYYRIGLGVAGEQRSRDIARLLETLDGLMFQAWLLEQRGDRREAYEHYREVEELVPDVRAPVTRVAIWRMTKLREKRG